MNRCDAKYFIIKLKVLNLFMSYHLNNNYCFRNEYSTAISDHELSLLPDFFCRIM